MAAARRRRRTATVLVAVLVVVVAATVAARTFWNSPDNPFRSAECTVGSYGLTTDQAAVAAQMVGEVTKFRETLPFRADVLVLMAGLQESKLTNLAPGDGDRDSVGVLQQRPSQGWGGGKASVLTNVGEATREFLEALVKVPDWQTKAPAAAIQAVQISADGSAYAKQQPEATALATAFTGRVAAGLACSFDAPTKVASATLVARTVGSQLGLSTPRATGDQVTVAGAHWQTATWFVANADDLGIARIGYDGRTWTRTGGWQRASTSSAQVVATMATPSR